MSLLHEVLESMHSLFQYQHLTLPTPSNNQAHLHRALMRSLVHDNPCWNWLCKGNSTRTLVGLMKIKDVDSKLDDIVDSSLNSGRYYNAGAHHCRQASGLRTAMKNTGGRKETCRSTLFAHCKPNPYKQEPSSPSKLGCRRSKVQKLTTAAVCVLIQQQIFMACKGSSIRHLWCNEDRALCLHLDSIVEYSLNLVNTQVLVCTT